MATDRKPNALTTLRERLAAHTHSMPVAGKLIGLDATLRALDEAMVEQARQQAALASALMRIDSELRQAQLSSGVASHRLIDYLGSDLRRSMLAIWEGQP